MQSRNIAISIWLVLASFALIECKNHHLAKRQALATVCQPSTCRYGNCEILTQYTFQCHCNAGITGTNCNSVAPATADKCSSNPCYGSGSTCVPQGLVGFTCFCAAGLTGTQCQSHLNVCQCQNGGACQLTTVNNVATYTCSCLPGFGGELCQFRTSLATCQIQGCQNGGTCTILSTCACPSGFSGPLCEISTATTTAPSVTVTPISICTPGICLNGGICLQLTNNIGYCSCPAGFYGIFCNFATNTAVTASTPTTTVLSTTATTTVVALTTPTTPVTVATTVSSTVRCTFSNPCLNGGTCNFNPTTNAIQCACLPNYTGFICQTQQPFCQTNPCQNGGTCVSGTGNAGTCTCATGYSGTFCEVGLTCISNPCLNNQQCVLLNNNPVCLCGAGYNPPFCS